MGEEVIDLFDTLPEPPVRDASTPDEYKITVEKLNLHFLQQNNVPYERHIFRSLQQKSKETIDQYAVKLRQQTKLC